MAKRNQRNRKNVRSNRKRRDWKLVFKTQWLALREFWNNGSGGLAGIFSRVTPYLLVALLAAVLPMLVIHGYSFVMRSPNFNVKHVRVEGQKRLTVNEVMEVAGVSRGPNVLSLKTDEVAKQLVMHPWIASARVERELPDRLVLSIVERQAVAQLALGALYLVDRRGELFKRVESGENFDWPVFTGLVREDLEDDTPSDRAGTVKRLIRGGISLLDSWQRIDRGTMMPLGEVHLDPLFGYSVVIAGNAAQGAGAVVHLGLGDLAPKMDKLSVVFADADRRGQSVGSVRLDDERDPNRVAVRFLGAEQSSLKSGKQGKFERIIASGEKKAAKGRNGSL